MHWKRDIALLAGAALLAACSDALPTDPGEPMRPAERRSLNAEFARIAAEVPGFGGMYYAAEGRLHVRVAGDASPAAIRRALTSRAGSASLAKAGASGAMVIEPADYAFDQLARWYDDMRPVLSEPGVVFTDIDEAANRLRVSVLAGTDEAQVAAVVAGYGVPAEAVTISVTEPIVPLKGSSLVERVQPLAGGLQLVFPNPMPGFVSLCTLGFNILRDAPGRSQDYFITNSHCSETYGGTDGTPFHQQPIAVLDPKMQIGTEVLDPPFISSFPGCFYALFGFVCRYSDAAIAAYQTARTPVRFGSIYRTEFFGTGSNVGSRVLAKGPDHFTIADDVPFPLGGETLDKIGRSTGWTRGPVIATCVDIQVAGTNIIMLCQDIVLSRVAGGDSGSPVFQQAGTSKYVTLYGILWGGASTLYVFSAMENMRFELGDFRTH